MVGIGQGIRCSKEENQQYRQENKHGPVIISYVTENCQYKEIKGKK
jgi:hypothetical protein